MCEYCSSERLSINLYDDISNEKILEMKISESAELTVNYDAYSDDSSFSGYRYINYCPMCGINLKECE